jgi:predicted RNase H-like nuclease
MGGGQAVSRYKYTKLMKLGPVDGFIIHTPDYRKLKDTHPQTIVRELNRMADRIKRLEEAGDYLCAAAAFMGWHDKIETWNKAKEAKL